MQTFLLSFNGLIQTNYPISPMETDKYNKLKLFFITSNFV